MDKFESVFAVSTANNVTQGYHDAGSWSAKALWTGSVLSCVLFLSVYLLLQSHSGKSEYPVPKGPRGLPILGKTHFHPGIYVPVISNNAQSN